MNNLSAAARRFDRIREQIQCELRATAVELVDESHLHIGHAGAREGKGHFRVRVVSDEFTGLRPLQRHRLVYRALGDLMHTDIHAMNIVALTSKEAEAGS